MGFLREAANALMGWNIKRPEEEEKKENLPSFSPPQRDDGAIHVEPIGASFAATIDLDGQVKTETELITRYRDMSLQTEIDSALNEIVGDAIITGEDEQEVVELMLDEIEDEVPEAVREKLDEVFDELLLLMDFNNKGYSIFRKWFIDGRIYYYAIIDETKPSDGILEIRYIDPRCIRKVREIQKVLDASRTFETIKTINEYYLYNSQGFGINSGPVPGIATETRGLKIAKDSIMYSTSGVTDPTGKMVLSYLHKAMKPLNQLRAVEDAAVIYRLVRAPERRVFYIDVSGLPKMKADQYMRDMMVKHKNRLVYDSSSGKIKDDRHFMTTVEDYWLPRRGDKGTQIDTLKGGENLGQMDDVNYFLKRLYRSLNVPIGRLDSENMMGLDIKATGITREEVSFGRFIDRLRAEFSTLFLQLLERQLMLKSVITPEDWAKWGKKIRFKWARDNLYAEAKDQEVLLERIQVANQLAPYVGIYFDHEYMRRYVFRQSDEQIRETDKGIAKDDKDKRYIDKYLPGTQPPDQMDPGMIPSQPDTGSPFPDEPESTLTPKTGRV